MKKLIPWGVVLCVLVSFITSACATIGYDQSVASHKNNYTDVTLASVWDAAIAAVMEINHSIESTDKESGLIVARGGENYLQDKSSIPMLTVLIRKSVNGVEVTCQANTLSIFIDPNKRIKSFFKALEKRL